MGLSRSWGFVVATWTFLFLSLQFNGVAQAGEIKVLKVKSGKAMVSFQGEDDLKVGDLLSRGGSVEKLNPAMGQGRRLHALGVSGSFSDEETEVEGGGSAKSKTSELEVYYKYNLNGTFEVGGFLEDTFSESGDTEISAMGIGPVGEFNFVKNESGVVWVPSLGLALAYAQTKIGDAEGSGTLIHVYLRLKYFGLADSVALAPDLGYVQSKFDIEGAEYSVSGLRLGLSLTAYF